MLGLCASDVASSTQALLERGANWSVDLRSSLPTTRKAPCAKMDKPAAASWASCTSDAMSKLGMGCGDGGLTVERDAASASRYRSSLTCVADVTEEEGNEDPRLRTAADNSSRWSSMAFRRDSAAWRMVSKALVRNCVSLAIRESREVCTALAQRSELVKMAYRCRAAASLASRSTAYPGLCTGGSGDSVDDGDSDGDMLTEPQSEMHSCVSPWWQLRWRNGFRSLAGGDAVLTAAGPTDVVGLILRCFLLVRRVEILPASLPGRGGVADSAH